MSCNKMLPLNNSRIIWLVFEMDTIRLCFSCKWESEVVRVQCLDVLLSTHNLAAFFQFFLHFYLFYFAKPLNNKMFASIKKGFNWYYKFKGPLKNVVSQENIVMHAKKNLSLWNIWFCEMFDHFKTVLCFTYCSLSMGSNVD